MNTLQWIEDMYDLLKLEYEFAGTSSINYILACLELNHLFHERLKSRTVSDVPF